MKVLNGKLYDADDNEIKPPDKCKPGYYWIPMINADGLMWLEQKDYKVRIIYEEPTE